MALGSKVNYAVYFISIHQLSHLLIVTDVGFDKHIVGTIFNINQIGQVSGISQFVKVDNSIIGIFVDKQANNMATDKSGSTCYDYISFEFHILNLVFNTIYR